MSAFRFFIVSLMALFFVSCQEDSPVGRDNTAASIDAYVNELQYDSAQLLNEQSTGAGSQERAVQAADTTTESGSAQSVTCISTTYSLKQNFDDIAILRPLAGIIWPGALVKGNASLMDGLPEPISLPRGPMTFTVDLPGMGEAGVKKIATPSNSTVQAAIDSALEWWNANAYQEGYVNPSSSSYRLATSYSSQQMALDVGLNVSWATSDVAAQFSYTSNEQKKVMMAAYKQAFYSIDMDTPENPSSVFDPAVSLEQIRAAMDSEAPPAYISSVVYGRIIMFRMETTLSVTSAELESSFRYAAGYSVDATLEARYKQILRNSTIEVVTLGGNAAVASEAVSARNAGDLEKIIKGDNAVYSRSNPGVPIAYTVRYLKDHALARLGYTTEYTATVCQTTKTADIFDITIKNFKAIKDCDTIGEGDFEIWVSISAGNKNYHKSSISLGNGQKVNLNWSHSFRADLREGNYFKVKFTCKEWDKDILGNRFGDSRMNKKTGSIRHEFRNSFWTNLGNGTKTITLNPGHNACSVSLTYTVKKR